MEEFAAVFGALDDPRTGNAKRHLLPEILLIALGTLLSGGASCAGMALCGRAKRAFLAEFLTLPHGISPATLPSAASSGCSTRCSSGPA